MADEQPKRGQPGGPGKPKHSEKEKRGVHLRKENRDKNGQVKPASKPSGNTGKYGDIGKKELERLTK